MLTLSPSSLRRQRASPVQHGVCCRAGGLVQCTPWSSSVVSAGEELGKECSIRRPWKFVDLVTLETSWPSEEVWSRLMMQITEIKCLSSLVWGAPEVPPPRCSGHSSPTAEGPPQRARTRHHYLTLWSESNRRQR